MTFFKLFFFLFVFKKKIKCSHSNIHNSISGSVPFDQTIKHFYSQFEVVSRITQDKYIVDRSKEKNEVFSFPLFHLRLTRINVDSIYTSYEANIFSLLAAFATNLRFASADASYIITKHNTMWHEIFARVLFSRIILRFAKIKYSENYLPREKKKKSAKM